MHYMVKNLCQNKIKESVILRKKRIVPIFLSVLMLQGTFAVSGVSASAKEMEQSSVSACATYDPVSATQTTIQVTATDIESKGFERAVQSALDTARYNATTNNVYKIVVAKGSYTVSGCLRIYSNTYLSLTGVSITRSSVSQTNILKAGDNDTATSGATGYTAYSNITIDGGTLNGGGTNNTMVKFAHGTNILLSNVTFSNIRDGHIMEVAGIDGFTVKNCNFSNQVLVSNNTAGYEAIQLDVLYDAHLVGYRSEDLPMKNVLVEGCTFKNCPRGVGSHTSILNRPFDGVKIKNCNFTDMTSIAIQGENWKNCEITGNTITNSPRGIAMYYVREGGMGTYKSSVIAASGKTTAHVSDSYITPSNQNIVISNNILEKCGNVKDTFADYDSGGIFALGYDLTSGCSTHADKSGGLPKGDYYINGVTIKNNKIDTKGHGIRLADARSTTVSGNTITCSPNTLDKKNYHGIFAQWGSEGTIINNSVTNASVNSIYVFDSKKSMDVTSNTVSGAKNYGISVDNAKAGSVKSNTVEKSTSNGIHVSNGGSVTSISSNTVKNAGIYGIDVVVFSSVGSISSNIITNALSNGIFVYNKSSVTDVIGNNISGAKKYGISIDNATAASIKNNTVDKSSSNGIHVSNGANVTGNITGNIVTNAGNHGISVVNASKAGSISSNTIYGCSGKTVNVGADSKASVGTNYNAPTITLGKATISGLTYKGGNNTLTWNKTSSAAKYQIARKKTGDSTYTYFTTSNTSFVDSNVKAGVTYTYQVRAMNGSTYGAWSSSRSVVTLTQPNLTVSNKSNGIRAEWNAVAGATKYIVYHKSELNSSWSSLETKNTYYPLLNTVSGRKYAFQVRPVGSGGSGPYSTVKNIVYTKATNEKPAVTVSNKSNGVRVEWKAVKGATSYIVYYRKASDSTWSSVQTSNLYYPYLSAKSGTAYCFQVQAVFNGVKGAYSSVQSITFNPISAEKPAVTVSNKSNGVRVEWKAVKGATSYIVYYRKASDSTWSSVQTSNLYYPYLSAKSGTAYCFQVQAVFNGVKGAYSSVQSITYYPTNS